MPEHVILWQPQPGPQAAMLSCPVFEVLYGGARGGGKTDSCLAEWAQHAQLHGSAAVGRFFRRERTQLGETIARARELYTPLGARWKEVDKLFLFPNGARVAFSYLDSDGDAEAYQGHSYTRVYMEELGNFPRPEPVMKLMATLRSAQGVPTAFRATANPGGPGHQWVKARYIDPAPGGYRVVVDESTGLERVFIPAKLRDNPALMEADPGYEARIRASAFGSAALLRAWLDGDWSVVEGAYFDAWSSERHVVRPFTIPSSWPRFRAADWGSARPFCVLWAALSDGTQPAFPRGSLVVYRELYGMAPGQPNTGVRLPAEAVAEEIKRAEGGERIVSAVIDPAAFASDGGPSIAERMIERGVRFRPADNKRLAGWDQVRARLIGEDGVPRLFVTSTCAHLIRTLPSLQHDRHRIEDVDTDGEDHAADALRYLCMMRPWSPAIEPPARKPDPMSLDALGAELDRAARERVRL